MEGRHIEIRGTVQGVGFRPWVYRLAHGASLTGHVRNEAAGVAIDAFGPAEVLDRFVRDLRVSPPPAAVIETLECTAIPPVVLDGFAILGSQSGAERHVSIPPDLATCADCLAEVRAPGNRRYRYPFTNCTNCGPRFTIAEDVPYDRTATSMRGFAMCAACRREYEDPADRRFHAQPNACSVCGPHVRAVLADGTGLDTPDAVRTAAAWIAAGQIVAVKGLGGFHLACDATTGRAVTELRRRKRRDEKPFAVMVESMASAERIAVLTDADRALLASAERPIVLVERRQDAPLAAMVAPFSARVGLFLPYTPLHHLLLADVGRPLVMTSGNVSDEPMAIDNEEARRRLGTIADLFLEHDRPIVTRADDSVAEVIGGTPTLFRRSRGYVPRALRLRRPVARPVLACGALLKNVVAVARGHDLVAGAHVGDLENAEVYRAYRSGIERLLRFLQVTPEVVAHDLHPDYLSTRFALAYPAVARVAVQHHHAHVVSAMVEHGLDGPVIGVAFDGTGLGTDGAAWGGEVLVADAAGFTRAATTRPLALPGGDAAIRHPWRATLAALDEAFEGEPPLDVLPLFRTIGARDRTIVRQMAARRLNTPLAHGIGRFFDVAGALVLGRPTASYEGQLAIELMERAHPGEDASYPFAIVPGRGDVGTVLDLHGTLRGLALDLVDGIPGALVAARFHNTLARATAALVRRVAGAVGNLPVVLTGGCFQNRRLAESVSAQLADLHVVRHGSVPAGDGGIAVGQAVIADRLAG